MPEAHDFEDINKTCPWAFHEDMGSHMEITCSVNTSCGDVCAAHSCAVWHFISIMNLEIKRDE